MLNIVTMNVSVTAYLILNGAIESFALLLKRNILLLANLCVQLISNSYSTGARDLWQ